MIRRFYYPLLLFLTVCPFFINSVAISYVIITGCPPKLRPVVSLQTCHLFQLSVVILSAYQRLSGGGS